MNTYRRGGRNCSDVIQIGAVKCLDDFSMVGQFKQHVYTSNPLNKYVLRLTGIDKDKIKHARKFHRVMNEFLTWQYNGIAQDDYDEVKFITWGPSDKKVLLQQCDRERFKVDKRFRNSWIDVQKQVQQELTLLKKEVQLINALKSLNITPFGSEHDALYDAINAQLIMRKRSTQADEYYALTQIGNSQIREQELSTLLSIQVQKGNKLQAKIDSTIIDMQNKALNDIETERKSNRLCKLRDEYASTMSKINELNEKLKQCRQA